ncbi:hypothetical protein P9112_012509 [Eukaryota sp. TZLM1-RC]
MTIALNLNKLKASELISISVNDTFESRDKMITTLYQYGIEINKEFFPAQNNNKARWEIRCDDEKCPFRFIATSPLDCDVWIVTNSIFSERQKGLINAVKAVLPGCPHAFCVKHLADNATGKESKKARPFVFRLAKVKNLNDYNDIQKEMAIVSQTAAQYIEKTADSQHWVEYMFPGNRWAHTTSNVVESLNAAINEAREQPIVQMFDSIRAMLGRWFVSRRREARAMIEFL